MWNFISQSGMARAVVDWTNDLSPLLIGLVSILWVSAAVIFCTTLRYYLAQKVKPEVDATPSSIKRREAA